MKFNSLTFALGAINARLATQESNELARGTGLIQLRIGEALELIKEKNKKQEERKESDEIADGDSADDKEIESPLDTADHTVSDFGFGAHRGNGFV